MSAERRVREAFACLGFADHGDGTWSAPRRGRGPQPKPQAPQRRKKRKVRR